MSETCGNCKFFKDGHGPDGRCRRYPPRVSPNFSKPVVDYDYPIVSNVEWCGEWVERNGVSAIVNAELAKQELDYSGAPMRPGEQRDPRLCEDHGCLHYGTMHGHAVEDLIGTVPPVAQAADLTAKRMRELYPNLKTPPVPIVKTSELRRKFLSQASITYGTLWGKLSPAEQCAYALPKAENEVLYLRDRFPALIYIVQTWPRPAGIEYQDWDVMRKALVRQLQNIIGTKDRS